MKHTGNFKFNVFLDFFYFKAVVTSRYRLCACQLDNFSSRGTLVLVELILSKSKMTMANCLFFQLGPLHQRRLQAWQGDCQNFQGKIRTCSRVGKVRCESRRSRRAQRQQKVMKSVIKRVVTCVLKLINSLLIMIIDFHSGCLAKLSS